jgi:hypothetical protein
LVTCKSLRVCHVWSPGEPCRCLVGASCGAFPKRLPDSKGSRFFSRSRIHVVHRANAEASQPSAKRSVHGAWKEGVPLLANDVETSRTSKQCSSGANELPKCVVEAWVEADWFSAWQNCIAREQPAVANGVNASRLSVRCSSIAHEKRNIVFRHVLRLTASPRGTTPFHVPMPIGVDHLWCTEVVRLDLLTT